MSREPDGLWTGEYRDVTGIDGVNDEELVFVDLDVNLDVNLDDDLDVDLDGWESEADASAVNADPAAGGDRDFYPEDL